MSYFKKYPATIFRFRPYSILTLKELQYGEVFFVANDELNDPYDTKNPHLFECDTETYKRLLSFVLDRSYPDHSLSTIINLEIIAEFLSGKPMLLSELIESLDSQDFHHVATKAFGPTLAQAIPVVILNLKNKLLAIGGLCYIASFSKTNNNPVMWSHYSNHHKGYCLCFSIEEGIFKRNKSYEQDFPKNLKFREVIYDEKSVTTNGLFLFPKQVSGIEREDSKYDQYWDLRARAYLTKFSSWSYEQEVRLVVDNMLNSRISAQGIVKKAIVERTFYYDQTQLTGIIFGSKMGENEKREIQYIIYSQRRNLLKRENYLPIFIFYQAKESVDGFKMQIIPTGGIDAMNKSFEISELAAKTDEYNNIKQLYLMRENEEFKNP
jgi:hypothetical protein